MVREEIPARTQLEEMYGWVYTMREIVLTKIVLGANEWIMSKILG
jgi:hypothetical protein